MDSSFIHLIRTDSNEFFLMLSNIPWDGCSGLVHWEDPEGWDGEGGRRGDRDGEHT